MDAHQTADSVVNLQIPPGHFDQMHKEALVCINSSLSIPFSGTKSVQMCKDLLQYVLGIIYHKEMLKVT